MQHKRQASGVTITVEIDEHVDVGRSDMACKLGVGDPADLPDAVALMITVSGGRAG